MKLTLNINGNPHSLDTETFGIDDDMPLLWILREKLGLTGTKFGCGIGACGACSVHFNGTVTRSCLIPAIALEGATITTIEGLANTETLHPLQQVWIEQQVPQCGYCQSGMLMAVSALLAQNPKPSDADIDAAITNICRCGTYPRIRAAIHAIAAG
jgi:isoquinoline 1-oxidoreductase alpha subunit